MTLLREKINYVITGVGIVGPFGTGRTVFRRQMEGDGQLPKSRGYAETERLQDFLTPRQLRRTDHFSQLALTALYLALENAHLEPGDCQDGGLVVASGYGPLASACAFKDTFFENGALGASPTTFTKSVHNQAASHIALQLGLRGPVATICQHIMPFQHALLTACLWLREKRVERVLVGGVDEFSSILRYSRSRYLAEGKKCDLAAFAKGGTVAAEGAAFFVLGKGRKAPDFPLLELPFFGNCPLQGGVMQGDCIIVADGLAGAEYWPEGRVVDSGFNFRDFYGYFPTAAALDLAAMTVPLALHKKHQKISHFEMGAMGRYGVLHLSSALKNNVNHIC